jgi:methylated-DNA-protein-cysteine methyltransferase-like protein
MLTRMPNTPARSRPARSRLTPNPNAAEAILAAIRAVPRGQVAGYGMIARRAGLPGRARLVARVLGQSNDRNLPWHRILRSDGRIAFPPDSPGFAEQSQRLRAEGVDVRNGRVRMPREDSLDAAVWSPC